MEKDISSSINDLFNSVSWFQFGILILGISVILLSLKLLIFILDNLSHQSKFTNRIKLTIKFILEHVEPFIILLVFGDFLCINPALHGIIALIVCVAGYRQIRDYITGKALKYNGALVNGSRLTVGKISGEIEQLRRLGAQVVSKDATQFFSYAQLYDQGFTIHANDAFGGYFPLKVSSTEGDIQLDKLKSIIINSPYTDELNDIKILANQRATDEVHLSVHLRGIRHLEDLKKLIRFKGYQCI